MHEERYPQLQPTHDKFGERIPAYLTQPKAEPTGRAMIGPEHLMLLEKVGEDYTERESPIRAFGESESRHTFSRINNGRLIDEYAKSLLQGNEAVVTRLNDLGVPEFVKIEQVEQMMLARGGASLIGAKEPLKNAEYFNRKLMLSGHNADFDGNELNGPEPTEPERKVPRFIFEPDTILYQEIEKVNVRLRLPYKECMFVQEMWTRSALETPNPDTFNVFAMELSDTKFFFMFDLHGIPFSVQVNQFRSKLSTEQVQYKAWLAEGPDKRLDAKDEKHKLADTAFRSVAPIIAFLEGMSQGVYTLEREGVQVPPSQVPPEAKEGVEYKVRSLRPNQPARVSVPLGGTHASPREHERKGHWRRNCHGVKKWIAGLTVNKGKTKGKVIKDYKIVDPTK